VHSQGARADLAARLALRGVPGPALVCTVQMPVDGFDVGPARRGAYRLLDRVARERVDRFIVVSAALHRTLVMGWGVEPERVELIPNGVDLDGGVDDPAAAAALRRALGIDARAPLAGGVGRLVEQKGFDVLIRALPAVRARVPGARLVLVGEGPERDRLARLAREQGVGDAVVFAGFRPDAPRLMAALDVLVLPSRREGAPLVTLEAMARAVPVVASDIAGIGEQVTDGVEGLLVPPEDPVALADAIARVLGDRALARRLGEAGRRRVRAGFDARDMVARTLDLYRAVARMPVAGSRRG
jgi:glycosyltransferase involved in cell wall biosynthesis